MFAKNRATSTSTTASLETRVAAAAQRIQDGRPRLADLEFLASKDITKAMYLKYKIEEIVRDILYKTHEDNSGVSDCCYAIMTRLNEDKWLAHLARQREVERKNAAKHAAISKKMKEIWEREAEEKARKEIARKEIAKKPEPVVEKPKTDKERQMERRRRVLERLTKQKEEMEEKTRKRKLEDSQEPTNKKQRIEVITID